jgi:hypothetical protein
MQQVSMKYHTMKAMFSIAYMECTRNVVIVQSNFANETSGNSGMLEDFESDFELWSFHFEATSGMEVAETSQDFASKTVAQIREFKDLWTMNLWDFTIWMFR